MTNPDAAFQGSIPDVYQRRLAPLLFEPYADVTAERIAAIAPGRVLETAAGTGVLTRALERRLDPRTAITATDLNPAMIRVATAAGPGRARWLPCDAMALPFDDEAFDLVASQFGVMFFPDRRAAYREAARVLATGGVLLFTVWDALAANDATRVVAEALADRYPDDPPTFIERVPFGCSDLNLIRAELRETGFDDVRIEVVTLAGGPGSALDAAVGICQGTPVRAEIEAREPGGLTAATDAAADALAAAFGDAPLQTTMQALLVTASVLDRRPSADPS